MFNEVKQGSDRHFLQNPCFFMRYFLKSSFVA